jgi:hypothetical protein
MKKEENTTRTALIPASITSLEIRNNFLDPTTLSQMKTLAVVFVESGIFPHETWQKLVLKFQAGLELGLTPFESTQSLYVVSGKVEFYGKAVPKQLRKHGFQVRYENETEIECTAIVENKETKEIYRETFRFEDAVKSGYTKDNNGNLKVGWLLGVNRKLKLRYGALNVLIRSYIPEVFGSVAGIKEFEEDFADFSKKSHAIEVNQDDQGGFIDDVQVAPEEKKETPKESESLKDKLSRLSVSIPKKVENVFIEKKEENLPLKNQNE